MKLRHAAWACAFALLGVQVQAQSAAESNPSTQPAAPAADAPTAAPEINSAPTATVVVARKLTGLIKDRKTKEGLPVTTVSVKGTALSTETDLDGRFVLNDVPAGDLVLRVTNQDYQTREVAVQSTTGTVEIELVATYLEEVVIVGRATETARKNLANAVATVKGEEINRAPAQTVDQALQGKVAGANIQSNSGAPGGGMQMRLRGVSTIIGNSAPLYIVDGVFVSDVAIPNGMSAVTRSTAGSNANSTQDAQVNRVADLNPNDIENVEILKGASAAAIYGSKASNGVVIITTKKGKANSDEPRVEIAQRFGTYQLSKKLGSRRFANVDEAVSVFGESARDSYQDGRVFDHEQQLSGRSDLSTETTASVAGAAMNGKTTYFASAVLKNDEGIIQNTGYEKQGIRVNLGQRFSDNVELQVTSNLLHTLAARGLSNNDNANVSHYMVLSSTPSFVDLSAQGDGSYPRNPFVSSATNPLQTAALMTNDEDVWRLLGSGDLNWKIWSSADHEVKANFNFGVDRFQQKNELFFPGELHFEAADGFVGTSLFTTAEVRNLNAGVNLVHAYRPSSGLFSAVTSAGVSNEERHLTTLYVTAQNLTGGQVNVDAATRTALTQFRSKVIDRGFYAQEEVLTLNERLTLTAAFRGETSTANGNPRQLHFYPKAAAAYRIPGLPSAIQELKVRAAYGETGNLPTYGWRFTPLSVRNTIEGTGGAILQGIAGDPNIRPERQREFEAGVDALMFDGNVWWSSPPTSETSRICSSSARWRRPPASPRSSSMAASCATAAWR
jgi:TonB-dependent starch-binding outer membrane protein SusC